MHHGGGGLGIRLQSVDTCAFKQPKPWITNDNEYLGSSITNNSLDNQSAMNNFRLKWNAYVSFW